MVSIWIPITIVEEDVVGELRDNIFGEVNSGVYEKEEFLHVSLFPGIKCSEECVVEIQEVVSSLSLEGREVPVDGFHFYPSRDDPMVVALDVDVNLGQEREMVKDVLEKCGGECVYPTVTPHLTLFKAGDSGDSWCGLSDEEYEALSSVLSSVDVPECITFESVRVEESSAW